jgi:hypothetical protein
MAAKTADQGRLDLSKVGEVSVRLLGRPMLTIAIARLSVDAAPEGPRAAADPSSADYDSI